MRWAPKSYAVGSCCENMGLTALLAAIMLFLGAVALAEVVTSVRRDG